MNYSRDDGNFSGSENRNYMAELKAGKGRGSDKPMPSREELLARNSFGSPDDNKWLDKMLARGGKK